MKSTGSSNIIRNALMTAGLAAVLAGCGNSSNDEGQIRVVHASPDAPAVNVLVDGGLAIEALNYAESSGFLTLDADMYDIAVEGIIPGGNLEVISVPNFELNDDDRTTVIAIDEVAAIDAFVVGDSAATPAADEVAINVVHAAAGAPEVDVYVTAPGDALNTVMPFTFAFPETFDAGALGAGPVQVRVTLTGTETVVYDSGTVDLGIVANQSILLMAVDSENATSAASSPIKLLAVTDDAVVTLLDTNTQTGAKVVHASPDATALAGGAVEVFATSAVLGVNPVELIDGFDYTDIVPSASTSVAVPAADDYEFDVAPDTNMIGDSVFNVDAITLAAGEEYSVIAAGKVGGDPDFTLLLTEDDNRAISTHARVKVVHAAPAAGDVDVFVTPAGDFDEMTILNETPALADFAFADITDYIDLAAGSYDIRVVAGGVVAINVEDFPLTNGLVASVIAIGPSESSGPQTEFGVLVLTN